MTQTTTLPVSASAAPTEPVKVWRQGFYLTSQGQPLCAWLHSPRPSPRGGHGVLLCPPIGYEQVHSHRALRHLADALARAGFVVCRIDYHGTGDSEGSDEDPDRVPTWQANVRDALRWIKTHLECSLTSVVGLRLGAALAFEAAAEIEVANLILWAPVLRGRTYVRELRALSLMGEEAGKNGDSPDLEAGGFVVTRQTADAIGQIDLGRGKPLCLRSLVVVRDDLSSDRVFCDRMLELGIDAAQVAAPGYAGMMAEPHQTTVPNEAIEKIVAWMLAGPQPDRPLEGGTEPIGPTEATSADGSRRDRLACVNRDPNVWGILSEPVANAKPNLPTIVLLNAGSAHRVGPNRWYVLLSRALTARGFRCLRLDVSGLGDSVAPDARSENDPYGENAFRDVEKAIEYLRDREDAKRIVLAGLCSGAYFAFQSAAQMRQPEFVESVMINPLTFFWKDGMKVETPSLDALRASHYYFRSALKPSKWLKFLSGRSRIGFLGAMKLLYRRIVPKRKQHDADASTETRVSAPIGHPLQENLPADLQRIAETGRHLSFFFSSTDPGHLLLMVNAGRKAKAMSRSGELDMFFLDESDHTFSKRAMRVAAIRRIADYLCSRYS